MFYKLLWLNCTLSVCKLNLNFNFSEICLTVQPTALTNKLCSWFSQTRTRADKTVCKDIALQRARRGRKDQITLLHTALCYLIDPAGPRSTVLQIPLISTWQENIGFLVRVMKCITLQICRNSTNKKMRHLLPRAHTQVKILPLPHSIKAHTASVQTECTHAWAESHICNKAASYVSLPHPSASVTQFRVLSSAQSSTWRQIQQHSVLFR